jgi:cell division protein FtsW
VRPRTISRRPVMLDQAKQRKHRPDYMLVLLCIALLTVGLIVVYAISPGLSAQKGVGTNYYATKQITAILLGIVTFLIAAQLPLMSWKRFEKPLIGLAALAALAVQLFGEEVNGAARWIQVGGLSFQAVELIKLALLIWLAGFLAARIKEGTLAHFDKTFKPLLMVVGIISLVVAVMQSDLGSAGVTVAIVGAMCFVAGLPLKKVFMFGAIIALGTILAISGSAYRRERLATFLNPERDCQNVGYQSCQALSAIGSGGMFGKGINRGVFAYGYLPESANDSIFAVFAEMFGFLGVVILISLFFALFARLKSIMERAPNMEARLLVAGILAWLSTQALINIGAMIGLLPLKGITLPFVSYGGTSIIFVTAAMGLAFNVSRYTTYGVNSMALTEGRRYEGPADRRGIRRAHYAAVSRRP